jgi:hypothetical protein
MYKDSSSRYQQAHRFKSMDEHEMAWHTTFNKEHGENDTKPAERNQRCSPNEMPHVAEFPSK